MKLFKYLGLIVCGMWLASCGGSPYADQARAEAVESAKNFIDNISEDELKMQSLILDAKAQQSEYYLLGDTIAAKEYEEAFRQYIAEHNDSIAKILF